MADLVHKNILHNLKSRILDGEFSNSKLPNEQKLATNYKVSLGTIKNILNILVQQGIIFKKRGAGSFVNPLYIRNQALFQCKKNNLDITDNPDGSDQGMSLRLLAFNIISATLELQQTLFLEKNERVYAIKRVRLLNEKAITIETVYIPVKTIPELNSNIAQGSIFKFFENTLETKICKAFLSIKVDSSTSEDQKLLKLNSVEPVGITEGLFFLDDGTPFGFFNMRTNYKYLRYDTFVSIGDD